MGKPVHKVKTVSKYHGAVIVLCRPFGQRFAAFHHFTTEDSGVTCKNCLKSMLKKGAPDA